MINQNIIQRTSISLGLHHLNIFVGAQTLHKASVLRKRRLNGLVLSHYALVFIEQPLRELLKLPNRSVLALVYSLFLVSDGLSHVNSKQVLKRQLIPLIVDALDLGDEAVGRQEMASQIAKGLYLNIDLLTWFFERMKSLIFNYVTFWYSCRLSLPRLNRIEYYKDLMNCFITV